MLWVFSTTFTNIVKINTKQTKDAIIVNNSLFTSLLINLFRDKILKRRKQINDDVIKCVLLIKFSFMPTVIRLNKYGKTLNISKNKFEIFLKEKLYRPLIKSKINKIVKNTRREKFIEKK